MDEEEKRVKKLKQDICNLVGHNMTEGRCVRCEALNLEGALKASLTQFVGTKLTSGTYEQMRLHVEVTLEQLRSEEEINDWRNVTVHLDPLYPPQVHITAEVAVPWHIGYDNVRIDIS